MVLLWTCHSTAGLCICILDAQNILPSHSGINNIKATGPRHCQALAAAAALHMEGGCTGLSGRLLEEPTAELWVALPGLGCSNKQALQCFS